MGFVAVFEGVDQIATDTFIDKGRRAASKRGLTYCSPTDMIISGAKKESHTRHTAS